MGPQPRTQRILFGIMQSKHRHCRYPKIFLLVYGVQEYRWLGRRPGAQRIVFGIVHFNQSHARYPKTLLLAHGVQRYGCLGRYPRTQIFFLALCNSNTPILGIRKHFCQPMGYPGMDVWSATPEPHNRYPRTFLLVYGVQR